MHNKRRPNNMGGGGQSRHNNNNRPRRFNNNNRSQGGEGGNDPASISRTRRNATQSREKYQMMARDAQSAGDRVLAEYYLQHAEHYFRVLLALPPEEVRQQPYQQQRHGHGNGEQPHNAGEHAPQEGAHNAPADDAPGLPAFITQSLPPEAPSE